MEKLFRLKENGTSVKTEIVAGLTTFMTMAYIIALNPNLLTNFATGSALWNAVFVATCLASAVGTACMAFLANKPFVMAPGMGLNSFFAVICGNMAAMLKTDYTSAFQATMCIILVEGIVFLLLRVFNIRDKIVTAIPLGVRLGIGPAIGLMLMNIGLGSNVGIYAEGNGFSAPFYVMRDFFGALTPSVIKNNMGDAGYTQMVLTVVTMFIGLFVMVILAKKGVKAAVLLGMLVASVVYWAGEAIFLGTDISEDAIALAKENAAKCGLAEKVKFAVMVGLDDFDEPQCVDVIVSNPPYIESAVCETLDPRVKGFEPRLALDGGASGLDFYDRYLSDAVNLLKPGGAVFFEIGEGQGPALERILFDTGFNDIKIEKDYAGHDRYASAFLP